MRKQLLCLGCSLVGMAFLSGLAACSSNKSHTDGGQPDSKTSPTDAGQGCNAGVPNPTYVLIDDMETTTHGPIEFDMGIAAPLTAGYWYNSGAGYTADAGVGSDDTSNPPQRSFVFTALPSPTTTLNCTKTSAHAARQFCVLNGLYDTCGVGFEFAQMPDVDAGATPPRRGGRRRGRWRSSHPQGHRPVRHQPLQGRHVLGDDDDAGPGHRVAAGQDAIPRYGYRPARQDMQRRRREYLEVLQQLRDALRVHDQLATVHRDCWMPATAAHPPDGGIASIRRLGYQEAQWLPTQVYGINWQAQKNTPPGDAGPALMTDIWVDDVYFIK